MELHNADDRRSTDRRQGQRRRSCRITYPPEAAPKVLNTDLRVANISTKGILLTRSVPAGKKSDLLTPESIRELKVQFHDQQVLDIQVEILRCEYDSDSHEEMYSGTIKVAIPAERIEKEQTCLGKSFPELVCKPL